MIDIQNHIRNEGLLNLFDGRGVKPRKIYGRSPAMDIYELWDTVAKQLHKLDAKLVEVLTDQETDDA